jgi:hypothetical protein
MGGPFVRRRTESNIGRRVQDLRGCVAKTAGEHKSKLKTLSKQKWLSFFL